MFFLYSAVNAATGINEQISFQGKVVNADGTNVTNGSFNFLFCLYTTASPVTPCTAGANNDAVWRESKSLTVTDGIFQSNLGDTTTLPGSVDFNTDNIYLGINFNADGQMTPLVRFTAAPYALNAAKVGGLTVTDTTGTLTIPNGKTISFADAFTTSGAFPLTLTSTASTTATLPSGTITLADLTTTQSLTNKTIGSTGLIFSGATTDITTGTGEDLTFVANGAGIISLNDATTVANILTANGGISLSGSQSLSAAALAYVDLGLITQSSTANQGLRLPNAASATPSNPTSGEGYLAWDAAGNQLITYDGAAWTAVAGGSVSADSLDYTDFVDAMTLDANLTLAQTTYTWGQTFTGATTTGFSYAADSLTSGTAFSINSAATALTGTLSDITLSGSNAANTGSLLAINNTGTSNANTSLYIKHYATGTNNLAMRVDDVSGDTTPFVIDGSGNVGVGDSTPDGVLDFDQSSTSTTADTTYGANFTVSDTGVVTTGTDTTYGTSLSVTRTGATGGTINTYGNYMTLTNTLASGSGAINGYGNYIALVGNGTGTSTLRGSYVDITGGADSAVGYDVNNLSYGTGSSYGFRATVDPDGSTNAYSYGLSATVNSRFTGTSNTIYGAQLLASNYSGGSGTKTAYGVSSVVENYNATGGTITTYGSSVTLRTDNSGAGTSTAYGSYIDTGVAYGGNADTMYGQYIVTEANASTTTYGAYVDVGVGAGTEYSGIFLNGNFGIGDATPTALLTVGASDAFQVNSSGAIAATTGITSSGVITANGGISLSGSQSLSAAALAYVDLGLIVHDTTALQGLRLPQAASAIPSNPTSGEGYLAWDAGGNQVIYYNGSAWATFGAGGGYATIKDESTGLTQRTTLAFLGGGVSCVDNATQTECTISGGAGSDLQGTYGADADGGNVTISLTAADDGLVFTNPTSGGNDLSTFLLQLDQANTTANVLSLDIIQASNASNAVNMTANAIDGETGLAITTNGLTSGSALTLASSATNFTGNLAGISFTGSNANNTGNVLAVSNTGTLNTNVTLFVDHQATGTNNLAVRVNDVSGDTTPFVIDGTGSVGIGTTAPARLLDIVQAASAPQLRLSKDLTNYSEMTVDSAGDLLIGATGTDIRALSENVWVCDNDACPALTLTGDGNIFVENVIKFGNGVYMKNDSATELGVYDNDDQAMLIFDEL